MAAAVFEDIGKSIDASLIKSINGVYQFNVVGANGQTNTWTVDLYVRVHYSLFQVLIISTLLIFTAAYLRADAVIVSIT